MRLAQASAANERVSALAAAEGLEDHLERARYGSTFDAHRVIHLAAPHDLQDAMEERLFRAYVTEGAALGESATLVTLAAEVGIDRDEARTALDSDAFADAVRADIARARRLGIQGVPFFVIDERYGISGAQPPTVITEVLDRAGNEAHPLITVAGSAPAAETCDGDSCALP